MFLGCSQEKLKGMWKECESRGLERKLEALASFIRRGDEPKLSALSRRAHGKRGMRVSRYHSKTA
jgi:hypothetical protein